MKNYTVMSHQSSTRIVKSNSKDIRLTPLKVLNAFPHNVFTISQFAKLNGISYQMARYWILRNLNHTIAEIPARCALMACGRPSKIYGVGTYTYRLIVGNSIHTITCTMKSSQETREVLIAKS